MNENVSAIFEGLNPEQLKAVSKIEGPVLIVAGAGSGKTKVLTCRIANILSKEVPASKVMSLTFTKKAATEMKERIAAMVGYRNARGLVMGTFHSVFVRFLREYAESLGYPKEFTIYDTSDSQSMVKACLKELNLDDKTYKPKNVLARISQAKNSLVTPAAYIANSAVIESDRNAKMPRLAEVYDLYWRKCRQSSVMDFDDILFEMNILLRDNHAALEELSQRFDYIMVDEYQDTNRAQYLILKKLAARHHNLCVVGDDSQSIYAFRGAKIENILNFRKDYPECEVFRLEQNYRSTQTIVDAANSLIAHNEGRIPKKCFSMGDKGELIRIIKAYTEQEEAILIASSILDGVRKNGSQYQDFAVLYRTNAQSRAIEEALRRRNIPYMIYSGNSFFERAEVKDMMAYLKLACNPADDESFKRVVNKPVRGIGDTTMNALIAAAVTKGITLMQAAYIEDYADFGLKAPAMAKLQGFTEMIKRFSSRIATDDAYKLTMDIANESGIWQFYKSDVSVEGQARFANIEELCNSVQSYIEQKQAEAYEDAIAEGTMEAGDQAPSVLVTIPEYLENVALLSAVDVEEDEDSSNKVALMTVHSSKGLEFPYVYVAGLEENLFPSGGMGARPNDVEEERRLFYVALTRAKKDVKLSFAATRMRNGKSESNPISRFVREIDPQYLDNPMLEDNKQARTEAFFSGINNYNHKPLYQRNDSGRMQPSSFGSSRPTQRPAAPQMAMAKPAFTKPALRAPDENFEASPVMDLRVGQRVEHNRFGCGLLKELVNDGSGAKATIAFDQYGEKVLLLKYAKIRIIS